MTPTELKTLRIQAGYSISEFAKMLGLKGDRTLRRWEAGTRPIREPMQLLIRELLPRRENHAKTDYRPYSS